MTKRQDFSRRLNIASQEAKDADRVWLLATAQHDHGPGEQDPAARGAAALLSYRAAGKSL